MPPAEALLVDADMAQRPFLPSGQAPLHRATHDGVRLPPGDSEQAHGRRQALRRENDVNREALEEEREPRAAAGPRHVHGLGPVFAARRPGRPAGDDRLELHRVQVPPRTLLAVVLDGAGPAAVGAGHGIAPPPFDADVDGRDFGPDLDGGNGPGIGEAEQLLVVTVDVRLAFHGWEMKNNP